MRRREAPGSDPRLAEEIAFHIDQHTEKLISQGYSRAAARREALRRFGGMEAMKEAVRDEMPAAWSRGLGNDVRFAIRGLRRAPAFAALAIATLGLGIAASTALFSVVQGVLLRELPYPDAGRIVRLFQINTDGTPGSTPRRSGNASEPNVDDWRRHTRSFAAIATMAQGGAVPVSGGREPVMAVVTQVSREFRDVMGVAPAAGRWFVLDEQREGGMRAAVISRAMRSRLFGEALPEEAVLRIGTESYAVVGEMPAGFEYPNGTAIWTPRELVPPSTQRTSHNVQAIARVAPDTTVAAAAAELSALSRRLREQHGTATWMVDATAVPLLEQATTAIKPALQLLFGAAIVLFVIACANVSNLLLARDATRRQEVAVQVALGAGRWRVMRQRLVEIVLIGAAASVLGLVMARAAVVGVVWLDPGSIPRLKEVALDWTAAAFAVAGALAATLIIGFVTSLRGSDRDIRGVLGDFARGGTGGRSSERARELLVLTQVGMTVVLLAGTALLARSFVAVMQIDPGYRTSGITVLDLVIPRGGEADARQRQWMLQERFLDRVSRVPGVVRAGLVSGLPAGGGNYPNGRYLEMTSIDEITSPADLAKLGPRVQERAGSAAFRVVGGDYFATMGIPVMQGRTFTASDTPDAPHVAVVSQSLAAARWPGRDPIGRFIQFGNMDGDLRGFRVVGVVGDVRELSAEAPPGPVFYVDYRQRPGHGSRVSIVVEGGGADLGPAAEKILREIEPAVPLQVRALADVFDASLSGRRFNLVLISVFGASALVLAVLGTYGLISFLVAQRRREISIRLALGAEPSRVLGLVIWRGARLALIGAAVGLAAALFMTKLVDGLLFSVRATDPLTLTAAVIVTCLAVVAASFVPAWRATGISPTETLK